MDIVGFERLLRESLPAGAIRANEPLAAHTTLGVGGPADLFVEPATEDQLLQVLMTAADRWVPVTMLGGGSNVVVADEGLRGVVIRLRLTDVTQVDATTVRAQGGLTMNGLVRWTIGRGLAAIEAWAGTPGTVGGAVYGNAHYGGRDIGEHITAVRLANRFGDVTTVPSGNMEFGYDTSRLQHTGEILISADFAVRTGVPADLRAVARKSLAHRKLTQPLAQPSAGCLFQNPDPRRDIIPPGVPPSAGALVDRAGLKGHRRGGAAISTLHANFLVSDGSATARDIWELAEAARAAVRDRFGVELRNEVVFLGQF